VLTFVLAKVPLTGNGAVITAKATLITAGVTTIAWIVGTFATKPEPTEKIGFVLQARAPQHLWVETDCETVSGIARKVRDFAANTGKLDSGCVMVYSAMFGIGMLVFRHWLSGVCSRSEQRWQAG